MKLRLLSVAALLTFAFAPSISEARSHVSGSHGNFGLGAVFGEPTAISAKYWNSGTTAFDFGLGYSFNDYVLIFADHLWHFPGALTGLSPSFQSVTPYVGVGPQLFISSEGSRHHSGVHDGRDAGIGVRIPLGLEWIIPRSPVGVFLELVPGLDLAPAVDGFIQGGIGVRFYFD